MNFLRFLPFSLPWIIRHLLGDAKNVLDVGCGDGSLMVKVNCDGKYNNVVGIDLYKPYLKEAKKSGVYKEIISADIRKIRFKNKSFDVVLASQVIEHLNKKEALKLLAKLEKIAKYKVIVGTPNGYVKFDPFEMTDDNKLQEHKSGWTIKEMEIYKYKVYGQGSGFIYRPNGLLSRFRRLKKILVVISYLLSPLSYFFPSTSAYMIAIKASK